MEKKILRIPHAERTEVQRRSDILENFIALLYRDKEIQYIKRETLHRIWSYYLQFLKMKGVEINGFYRDVVNRRYEALDRAVSDLLASGFIYYKMPSTSDYIYFNFTPRMIHAIQEHAEPNEWKVSEESIPFVSRLISWDNRQLDDTEEDEETGIPKRISFEEFVRRTLNPA